MGENLHTTSNVSSVYGHAVDVGLDERDRDLMLGRERARLSPARRERSRSTGCRALPRKPDTLRLAVGNGQSLSGPRQQRTAADQKFVRLLAERVVRRG